MPTNSSSRGFAMATKQSMVTAVFRDRAKAQKVYQWLVDNGYPQSDLNVLMSDKTRSKYYQHDEDEESPAHAGNQAVGGMAVGGAVGTAVGAGLAAVAA